MPSNEPNSDEAAEAAEESTQNPSEDASERFAGEGVLPVFETTQGEYVYRLFPRFSRGRTRWAVQVLPGEEEQIVYEAMDGLTDRAVDDFDVDPALHERLRDARAFVSRAIDLFPIQGNREQTIYELEALEPYLER